MKKILLSLLLVCLVIPLSAQPDPNYKPRRLNKAIELLEDNQPIYSVNAGNGGYEDGKRLAQTFADVISYESEHAPFDIPKLREFMRGLSEGGPTKSGHKFPMVKITLPVLGYDAAYMKANSWVIQQALAAGVMAIHLCHARDPEAVRVAVAAMRYPFERPGVSQTGTLEGLRGAGSQNLAAGIWGISPNMYVNAADVWPLNPRGEVMLGLKIEDKYGLANAEKLAAVPGVGFSEWGPTDQTMSLIGLSAYANTAMPAGRGGRGAGEEEAPMNPVLVQARARIEKALLANHVAFLDSGCNESNIIDKIKEGVLFPGGCSESVAKKGREFTKRKMPY